jgi:hypothetical protein
MVGHWHDSLVQGLQCMCCFRAQSCLMRVRCAGLTDDEEEKSIIDGKIYGNYCGAGWVRPAASPWPKWPVFDFFDAWSNRFCGDQDVEEGPSCRFNVTSKDDVDQCCKLHDEYSPHEVLSNCRPGPHYPPLTHVLIGVRMKCDAPFFRCCGNPQGLVPTTRTKQCNVDIFNCLEATPKLSIKER